jgi:hypothetical protein
MRRDQDDGRGRAERGGARAGRPADAGGQPGSADVGGQPGSAGRGGQPGSAGPGGQPGSAGRGGRPESAEPGGQPESPDVWAAIREADRMEKETVGPFPSWAWVYGTVVVFGILLIGLLVVLTRVLDPGSAL